ncbi:MAG: lipid-A-disaccharide synthase [Cyanobacteria bacterium]|nr:lipid-A-disaccharide synthase [Cyanobacteriota bacterium]MDW8201431.1 lipid-A-disaccharide synthase [Cyanobacteriota bacterium SKYGB_h_bin112]
MKSYRIFISTGEVSGDLQGSLLIEALQRQAALLGVSLEILAMGGDRMEQAGATILANTKGIGSVGILESLPFVLPTLRAQQQARVHLQKYPPDLVVLIDYIQPNLNLGKYLRKRMPHLPIVYYIAPQNWVWAMNLESTRDVVAVSDRILAIFPEEARYFQAAGAHVTWVGHPLVERMQAAPNRAQARAMLGLDPEQPVIALIPVSRRQELVRLLPVVFSAAQRLQEKLPNVRFLIPLALDIFRDTVAARVHDYSLQATIVDSQTPDQLSGELLGGNASCTVIAASDLAIAKSGTVNLEIALLNVPQVVVYRLNPLTAWLARNLFNFSVPFVAPPNLVQMKPIVPELLQEDATADNIFQTSFDLLHNQERRQQMLTGYAEMRQALGEPGACDRAAQEILQMLPATS